ncbi:uncharacterized protein LOC126665467 [Mercurialis annua]|uniref:uncharacterized protein LOC126665467 n=1 Tax=Mercurialis annua TaxID=3986 RepID=UPI00215F03AB|nr:uncharacterized protein LOC126665467 [Mercurialis annua]XP_055960327.1 uncharacterized protein LOC126665467 [Mercurialis annua]
MQVVMLWSWRKRFRNLTCEDACSDFRHSAYARGISAFGGRMFGDSAVTFLQNESQPKSNCVKSLFQADLSPQNFSSRSKPQHFLVFTPTMQRRPNYPSLQSPSLVPPHALLYNNAPCFDPNIPLFSSLNAPGVISHDMTNPQICASFPYLSTFSGAPHLTLGQGGPGSYEVANLRFGFDLNGGITSLESRNWIENGGQQSVPVNIATTDDQKRSLQHFALSAASMKRSQPEGGWDSHQFSFRQMASRK